MRPTLTGLATALTFTDPRFPWVGPSPEEKEVASLLLEMDQIHVPDRLDPDDSREDPIFQTFGFCLGCAEQWPCRAWSSQESEGITWVAKASERVIAHARGPLDRVVEEIGDRVRCDARGRPLAPVVRIHADRVTS